MPWWALLIEVCVVWLLWCYAAVASKAVADARKQIPNGQRSGVSLAPVIPFFPLGFWALAMLADFVVAPWGTWVIAWFHGLLSVLFAGSIAHAAWRLHSLGWWRR
jgi:hypothetical protein